MQIVIDIHENDYKTLMINGGNCSISMAERIIECVHQGKKLPKGHGNLIDVNELEPDTEWNDYEDGFISYSRNQIKCAKVIIEADKELKDEKL